MKNNQKNNQTLWLVLLVCAVIGCGWFYWEHHSQKNNKTAVLVETVFHAKPIVPQNITVDTGYIGYVVPINEVNVLPYINGFISDVKVSGGTDVKTGDKLVVIEQGEYKAKLDAASAAVKQAQAAFNNAKIYYERIKKAGEKAVSKTEYDNARAAYLQAEARLSQARADYNLAEVNFKYTEINATIDGIVGNVSLSNGDYISPAGEPLFSIIQYDPIRVVFSITDKDYIRESSKENFFAGDKIKLRLSDGKIYEHFGEYKYADNQINKATNSIAVYADFANSQKKLIAGSYVTVLVSRTYDNIVLIPKNLMSLGTSENTIYTVQNGVISKKVVTILGDYNNNYIVSGDFAADEALLLENVSQQDLGKKVKVEIEANGAV